MRLALKGSVSKKKSKSLFSEETIEASKKCGTVVRPIYTYIDIRSIYVIGIGGTIYFIQYYAIIIIWNALLVLIFLLVILSQCVSTCIRFHFDGSLNYNENWKEKRLHSIMPMNQGGTIASTTSRLMQFQKLHLIQLKSYKILIWMSANCFFLSLCSFFHLFFLPVGLVGKFQWKKIKSFRCISLHFYLVVCMCKIWHRPNKMLSTAT